MFSLNVYILTLLDTILYICSSYSHNNVSIYLLFYALCSTGEGAFVPTTVAQRKVTPVTECLVNHGVDFTGDVSVTLGGHTCMSWASPKAKSLSRNKQFIPEVKLLGNKCRNPDDDPEGPWCFVEVSGNVTIDYCDLELCG